MMNNVIGDFLTRWGTRLLGAIGALAVTLAAICCPAVAAADAGTASAGSGDGSITVTYEKDGTALAGVEVRVHRVAEIAADGASGGAPTPTPDFAGYAVDWGASGDEALRTLAETLAGYAARDGIEPLGTRATDAHGTAAFEGLPRGLYLVIVGAYRGDALRCDAAAMLVALPSGDAATSDAAAAMHVTLQPKSDCTPGSTPPPTTPPATPPPTIPPTTPPTTPPETPPATPPSETPRNASLTVRKVWRDDDASTRPESIVVQLLRDGEVHDQVTLDAAGGWSHTWTDLESGHDWRVVERSVPDGYTVAVDREGAETLIVNTGTTPVPHTGAAVVLPAAAGAICLLLALMLLAMRRHLRRRN
ncbi:Cna B-type domain-containing protein [Bifidobacterium moraviense]|nr:Cna B-type domain-containing protein [Bifidobacterium sp. DSM 109958]